MTNMYTLAFILGLWACTPEDGYTKEEKKGETQKQNLQQTVTFFWTEYAGNDKPQKSCHCLQHKLKNFGGNTGNQPNMHAGEADMKATLIEVTVVSQATTVL